MWSESKSMKCVDKFREFENLDLDACKYKCDSDSACKMFGFSYENSVCRFPLSEKIKCEVFESPSFSSSSYFRPPLVELKLDGIKDINSENSKHACLSECLYYDGSSGCEIFDNKTCYASLGAGIPISSSSSTSKPPSRECYKLMYTFNTFEFEDGDGVPHSISLNVGNTMSLLDARSLGLAPLPTMRSHISSSASSKFEKVSFEDTGDQNGLVDKTFTHSFAGDVGYKVVLTGWTHTRKYHKGYLRNTQGIGRAVVKGLDPSSSYDFRIYQYATSYAGTNSYSVQGRAMGSTTTSTDSNPTATGTTTSNNKGEIDFMFNRIAHHVALSGLSLKLNMPLLSECEGNCKEDKDCVDNLKCFKRTADVTSPVPGCTRGGPMDKPDFNYCYNPVPTNVVDELSFRIEDQCTNRALVSTGSLLGK